MAESNITISSSVFKNGFAKSGGAIYISGDSSLYIENSQFLNNVAIKHGGAIAADAFNTLKIY